MSPIEVTHRPRARSRARRARRRRPRSCSPTSASTVAELDARAERFAQGLLGLGVQRYEHVGILAAAQRRLRRRVPRRGEARAPSRSRSTRASRAASCAHVIPHAELRVLFVTGGADEVVDYAELAPRVVDDAPLLRDVVQLGRGTTPGFLTLDAVPSRSPTRVDPEVVRREQSLGSVRELGMIMYTSGTTAAPKGCLLTPRGDGPPGAELHRALPLHAGRRLLGRAAAVPHRRDHPAARLHGGGLPLRAPGRVRRRHGARPARGRALHASRCRSSTRSGSRSSTIRASPRPTCRRCARCSCSAARRRWPPPRSGSRGSPRSPAAARRSRAGHLALGSDQDPLERRTDHLRAADARRPGADHRPGDRRRQPPGETGELLFRGAVRFEGYYKDPEVNARMIDADGWYHSGDLASLDEEGYLVYGGPLKDALKVGGENVSPLEVEDFLARHPAVNIASVIGAPDARYTEVPGGVHRAQAGRDGHARRRSSGSAWTRSRRSRSRATSRFVDRVADVGDEDREAHAARAAHRRAGRRRDHRGAARARPAQLLDRQARVGPDVDRGDEVRRRERVAEIEDLEPVERVGELVCRAGASRSPARRGRPRPHARCRRRPRRARGRARSTITRDAGEDARRRRAEARDQLLARDRPRCRDRRAGSISRIVTSRRVVGTANSAVSQPVALPPIDRRPRSPGGDRDAARAGSPGRRSTFAAVDARGSAGSAARRRWRR